MGEYLRFFPTHPKVSHALQASDLLPRRYGCLPCISPQAWEAAFVKVLVQLGPFDRRPMRFDNPAHIARLAEKLTRQMDSGVP